MQNPLEKLSDEELMNKWNGLLIQYKGGKGDRDNTVVEAAKLLYSVMKDRKIHINPSKYSQTSRKLFDIVVNGMSDDMEFFIPRPILHQAGKSLLANAIIDTFPEHDRYVEVFAGSAAVFWKKEKESEEVLNDLADTWPFVFNTLKNLSDDDIKYLESKDWKSDKETFYSLRELMNSDKFSEEKDLDRLYTLMYISKVSFFRNMTAFDHTTQGKDIKTYFNEWKDRLSGVTITQKDYKEILEEYDDEGTLFFLDPPYYAKGDKRDNIRDCGGEIDLDEFAEICSKLKGKAIITLPIDNDITKKFTSKGMRLGHIKKKRRLVHHPCIKNEKPDMNWPVIVNFSGFTVKDEDGYYNLSGYSKDEIFYVSPYYQNEPKKIDFFGGLKLNIQIIDNFYKVTDIEGFDISMEDRIYLLNSIKPYIERNNIIMEIPKKVNGDELQFAVMYASRQPNSIGAIIIDEDGNRYEYRNEADIVVRLADNGDTFSLLLSDDSVVGNIEKTDEYKAGDVVRIGFVGIDENNIIIHPRIIGFSPDTIPDDPASLSISSEYFSNFGILSTAKRKSLPDSDFCFVKEIDGKKVRKFPVYDKSHVRNALARLPMSNLSDEEKRKVHDCIRKKAEQYGIKVNEYNELYYLSRGVETPPTGISGFPKEYEELIPEHYQYWKIPATPKRKAIREAFLDAVDSKDITLSEFLSKAFDIDEKDCCPKNKFSFAKQVIGDKTIYHLVFHDRSYILPDAINRGDDITIKKSSVRFDMLVNGSIISNSSLNPTDEKSKMVIVEDRSKCEFFDDGSFKLIGDNIQGYFIIKKINNELIISRKYSEFNDDIPLYIDGYEINETNNSGNDNKWIEIEGVLFTPGKHKGIYYPDNQLKDIVLTQKPNQNITYVNYYHGQTEKYRVGILKKIWWDDSDSNVKFRAVITDKNAIGLIRSGKIRQVSAELGFKKINDYESPEMKIATKIYCNGMAITDKPAVKEAKMLEICDDNGCSALK